MYNSRIVGTLPNLGSGNDKVKNIKVDWGGGIVTISHEHSKVHDGEMFIAGYFDSSVSNSASIELLVQCASTHDLHGYFRLSAGGDAVGYLYEDTTFSDAGTADNVQNSNRSSANTANCTITHGPTLTADGDLIATAYMPGGSGGTSQGLSAVANDEQVVLAAGKNYLIRLTNIAGNAQPMEIALTFYEVAV